MRPAPRIFSNLPDAKPEHQYVISFFELSYNECTLNILIIIYNSNFLKVRINDLEEELDSERNFRLKAEQHRVEVTKGKFLK